jgi:hypothetical protein
MLKQLLVSLSLLGVVGVVAACQGSESSDASETGDDQEVRTRSVQIIAEGGICQPGSKKERCVSGTSCADNCPDGALCFVSIFTCQPKAPAPVVIKKGGVCQPDESHCAGGLICKDNCPAGARCFVSIFTCQPQ